MKTYYNKDESNIRLDLVEDLLEKDFLNKDELRRANRYYYHPNGVRRCSKCQEVKAANSEYFYVKKYFRNDVGEVINIGLSGNCKSCDKIRMRKDKQTQRQDPELYCKRIIASLRYRAKEQGVPFDLTGEALYDVLREQDFLCFYTKGLLDFNVVGERDSHPHRNMPSVDKIEPSLGYVVGNIAWTYYYVNRAKNDLNLEEFLNLCQLINSNFIRA